MLQACFSPHGFGTDEEQSFPRTIPTARPHRSLCVLWDYQVTPPNLPGVSQARGWEHHALDLPLPVPFWAEGPGIWEKVIYFSCTAPQGRQLRPQRYHRRKFL